MATPFTVKADIDLGERVRSYLCDHDADVNVYEGDVPHALEGAEESGIAYQVTPNAFLLKLPNGTRYLVRDGKEIIYHRGENVSDRDVALFLLGSAWGALCYQRDLLPLHASAVSLNGQVYSFTGVSGAGKSTLSAALTDRGFDFFTDDVLIIDPKIIAENAICYAGQKDLKLWKDSLEFTSAEKMGAVRDAEGFEKYFATPANLNQDGSGVLRALCILETMEMRHSEQKAKIEKIAGGQALLQLANSVYRPAYANRIWGRKKLYSILGELIKAVDVYNFTRPFVKNEFDVGLSFATDWIHNDAASLDEAGQSSPSEKK